MKVNNLKRIVAEDFESDDQDLIRKLSFSLNPMLEQITQAFNKNIDFDNLNMEIMYLTVEVDSTGIPKSSTFIKNPLKTRIRGVTVINAENQSNSNLLTGSPFIAYTLVANGITVNQITGLSANCKYRLTLIIF